MKHQPVLVEIDGDNHVLPVGGEVAILKFCYFVSLLSPKQFGRSYFCDYHCVFDISQLIIINFHTDTLLTKLILCSLLLAYPVTYIEI